MARRRRSPGSKPAGLPELSPSAEQPRPPWLVLGGLILLVTVAVVVVQAPALSAQAVCFDDDAFFVNNPLVLQPSGQSVARFFGEVFEPTTVKGYYLPLSMTSLMLDCAMGARGDDLRIFHRTALLLHVLNTALVVVLLYALVGSPLAAAGAGLLFGVHPLMVEPVAWVGERKTLLATFFALWSLVLYVRFARRGGWGYGAASLGAYLLALLSKPTVLPLPLVMLLLDYWPLRRLSRRAVLEKVPLFAVAATSALVTLISHAKTASLEVTEERSPLSVLLLCCHNLLFYLGECLWPANLSPCYAPPPLTLTQPAVVAGVLAVVVLSVGVVLALRRSRAPLVAWVGFVVLIGPMLGVVRYSWVVLSDKYMYLPAVVLLLPVAALVAHFSGRRRTLAGAAVVVLAVVAGVAARGQWAHWRNTETLYRHMIALTPEVPLLHSNLGLEFARQGRVDEAIAAYREALRLDAQAWKVRTNLAVTLAGLGRFDEAIAEFEAALEAAPEIPHDKATIHNGLGDALASRGEIDAGLEHIEQALQLNGQLADAHNNRGRALLLQNRLGEARDSFAEAVRLDQRSYRAHSNLGAALARLGKPEEALDCYRTALRLKPDFVDGMVNMGVALQRLGRLDDATERFRQAIRTEPRALNAYRNLAAVLLAQNNTDEAIRVLRGALQLAPNDRGLQDALRAAETQQRTPQP
ncbi:MAG: tetratricopeptide repeat protein [Phycisphaerae bacterium]|jgi:tetratricopeptide (TPR) repeat protein